MKKLTILIGLVMALALALPGGAEAAVPSEVKKLIASDHATDNFAGWTVAVSGDTAVVGAYRHDHPALLTGAAYVYQRNVGGVDNWGEVKELTASDALAGTTEGFGWGVAIDGDTIVVSTLRGESAYVFDRNQGGANNWGEVRKLLSPDPTAGDEFGSSVTISGDTAIIGAVNERPLQEGAAFLFERNQGGANNWGFAKKLTASDPGGGDRFGGSVAIDLDTAIVAAEFEDGTGGGGGAPDRGAAYVFERNQGGANNWGEVKKITASDTQDDDFFGRGVAIRGDTAVVGAPNNNAAAERPGKAYVFERDVGGTDNWGEVKKLTASNGRADDGFGNAVGVDGDTVIIGARVVEFTPAGGMAYVFERDEGGADNWGEVKEIVSSDIEAGDQFGVSVAISGATVLVGAYREGFWDGAAYVFQGPEGNTSTGTDIKVSLPPVQITFSTVKDAGDTTVTTSTSGPPPPGGLRVIGTAGQPQYYDINTTATFNGTVTVCIEYDETDVQGPEANLKLRKFAPPSDITQSLDTTNNIICGKTSSFSIFAIMEPLPDEQININVVDKLSGAKLEGTCWRISYGPAKVEHDVVGDDSGGVKPDCGEPSNVKLFDKDPSAGNLRITITSAQRAQFGDIWQAQMSFSPISGGLDTFSYECDLLLGKCTIGPVPVGGLVVDLDEGPLAAAQPSGGSAGRLAGTVAGIAALAAALTGAAWYARQRL